MRNIREILRMKWDAKLSARQIAKSCNISHNTVTKIIRQAEAAGITWPLPDNLDEVALQSLLYPANSKQQGNRPEPDMNHIHRELKRKGVTLTLLWQEYIAQHPDGLRYSQFCDRYHQWREKQGISMHQIHKAGEKMFVDWAGQTFPIVDPKTGAVRDAYLFVAALGASDYTYAEAFSSQDLPHWIAAHCHAFAFFDGVPEIIVPDNLKTGVTKPCYYEPDINPTYQEMAVHYGTVIIPARVRKPKDKAKVENAVQVAERWILAALRNYTFFSLGEFNAAIAVKLNELNNKPFQKMEGSRKILFETIDKPALKPLPEQPYEFALWKKARVNIDYHIEFESNYYSVPYQLIRQEVELRITANVIEVFFKGKRVASHTRSYGKRQYRTDVNHLPPAHQKYLEWTPSRLIQWAGTIGVHTAKLVREMLNRKVHPEQAYRSCLGVLRLAKSYPPERIEAAAKRALFCHTLSYKSLKSILENNLDQAELPEALPEKSINHENIRGAAYYNGKGVHPEC